VLAYELTEEQRMLKEMLHRVAEERVKPRAAEIDRKAEYPQDMFEMLRDLGVFTLPFPKEYGGTDSMVSACLAVEELGRVCYNTAYLLVVQWSTLGGILHGGTPEQKEKLIAGLAAGKLRGAISVTEPQAGSDVARIQTRAEKVPGGYALTGTKIYCTNAAVSDFIMVAARVERETGHEGIGVFLVEPGTPGFEIARHEDKLGARGIPSSELHFDKAFVPEANRMGGFKAVMAAFNHTRPIMGARAIGLATGAMELAIEYAKQRQAFGQAVADFQGIRWMIADMAMQIEASRGLVYSAAKAIDSGADQGTIAHLAAIAKCFSTDMSMKVATDAVQIFASAGISRDFPIERYFRDAKVLQIIEGTNQIQRNIIANGVMGRAGKK